MFCGGNRDFPKIRNLKNSLRGCLNLHKKVKIMLVSANVYSKTVYCFENGSFALFQFGGMLIFKISLKSFISLTIMQRICFCMLYIPRLSECVS